MCSVCLKRAYMITNGTQLLLESLTLYRKYVDVQGWIVIKNIFFFRKENFLLI